MTEPSFEIVFAGHHLRAVCFNPCAKHLVVSFDFFRPNRRNMFYPVEPLSTAVALGRANLRVQSAANDWFLNPETEALERALARFAQRFATVRGFGFSMGGYGALRFAEALRLEHVLLMSPQATVRPERDRRWWGHWGGLDPALEQFARQESLSGAVLFDPLGQPEDRDHARQIAAQYPQIAPVAVPYGGHPAGAPFRDARVLRNLFIALITGHADAPTLHRLRRQARSALLDYPPRARLYGYTEPRGIGVSPLL